jgi:hypothetical protein
MTKQDEVLQSVLSKREGRWKRKEEKGGRHGIRTMGMENVVVPKQHRDQNPTTAVAKLSAEHNTQALGGLASCLSVPLVTEVRSLTWSSIFNHTAY